MRWNGITTALCGLGIAALLITGCQTGGSGGGGGGSANGDDENGSNQDNNDPLPQFQLGAGDDQLDADVAAIVAADVRVKQCLSLRQNFDDESVLLSLKRGFSRSTGLTETFPEFVSSIAALEPAKADEICNTTLENASAELLALVERLTITTNRELGCKGEEQTGTDETSLLVLMTKFFETPVRQFPTVVEAQNELIAFIEEMENDADEACADDAG